MVHAPAHELCGKVDGAVESLGLHRPNRIACGGFSADSRPLSLSHGDRNAFVLLLPVCPRFSRGKARGTADIETERAQVDDIAHAGHAPNAQLRPLHLVFQMRHGRLDAGAPSVDFAEGLAALIKPALPIGGSLGRILKAGELAVAFGRLRRASLHIRTLTAY